MSSDGGNDGVLRLTLEGVSVKNMETGFLKRISISKSDCFWQAETPLTAPDGSIIWQAIHRSETIMDNLNPQWKPADLCLDLTSRFDRHEPIRISVFDWEESLKPQPMGYFTTSVHQLLQSKAEKKEDGSWDLAKANVIKNVKGEEFGKIVVVDVEVVKEVASLELTLEGVGLVDKQGIFDIVNDPFYIVETPVKNGSEIKWLKIYRSGKFDDIDKPRWHPAVLNLQDLCQGNLDKPIRISWFDEKEYHVYKALGHCITSVRRLLRSKAKVDEHNKWDITRALVCANEDGQEFGQVVVVDADILTEGRRRRRAYSDDS